MKHVIDDKTVEYGYSSIWLYVLSHFINILASATMTRHVVVAHCLVKTMKVKNKILAHSLDLYSDSSDMKSRKPVQCTQMY